MRRQKWGTWIQTLQRMQKFFHLYQRQNVIKKNPVSQRILQVHIIYGCTEHCIHILLGPNMMNSIFVFGQIVLQT